MRITIAMITMETIATQVKGDPVSVKVTVLVVSSNEV